MYYIIILLIELFVLVIYKIFSKRQFRNIKISLIIILIFYIILNIMVKSRGVCIEYKLNTFDLNGDGIFSGAEVTPEQEEAMNRWTNDLGRNLFPIIFGIFSVIIFIILIIAGKLLDIIIKKIKDNKIRTNST